MVNISWGEATITVSVGELGYRPDRTRPVSQDDPATHAERRRVLELLHVEGFPSTRLWIRQVVPGCVVLQAEPDDARQEFSGRVVENGFGPVVAGPDPVPSVDIDLDVESTGQRRKHGKI